ncbi:MAG: RNA-binding domain-containing protein [Limisphaerales bacterium]
MAPADLKAKLDELLRLPAETEWVEFKEAKSNLDSDDLGRYFVALGNEANLKGESAGWLVLGIQDKPRKVVGSQYRPHRASLDSLKQEIAQHTTGRVTFKEIHEVQLPEGRVVMLEIPPAPQGIPIAWKGHFYGRDGPALGALNLQEIEQIRSQAGHQDWSAQTCPAAAIGDLDPAALALAREKFRQKNSSRPFAADIPNWDDATFLKKIKLAQHGKITRAALLLLGKSESTPRLSPAVAQITWKLDGEEQAYEHFDPPFLLNVNAVFARIRNLKFRLQPFNQLVPIELEKYDAKVVLEALNNCIAHQDYSRQSRIIVVEKADRLIFENAGNFFEGSLEDYLFRDRIPRHYRNRLLAEAMVSLDMIDALGMGIKRMFLAQRNRYFPLPEYDFSQADTVRMEIMGRLIDENYSRVLIEKADLDLGTVVALDKVQKRKLLTSDELKLLRRLKLVEGRAPNVFVASKIAALTGDKAQYIRNRAFDDAHYKKMILDLIREFGMATRKDVDSLLIDKLSDALSGQQKRKRIGNLLYAMAHREKSICNRGSDKKPQWIVVGAEEKSATIRSKKP